MNIWSLKKDLSIKHLLLLLTQSFGSEAFEVVLEHDEKKSFRLYKKNDNTLSVYIFTYGQQQDCYGVHLEYPDLLQKRLNNTLDIYDNMDYQTMCNLIQNHLNISSID